MSFELLTVPCLSDNYAFLAHDADTKATLLVDAPESEPIISKLKEKKWDLTHVLLTHHHWDHVDGLSRLLEDYSPQIIGSFSDMKRLPPLHLPVADNDEIKVGNNIGKVFEVPGHTIGHIAVYFKESNLLFSADTLMALGCGRLFEGTAGQMWHSLQKLLKLPDETVICSGHEYTETNANFALSLEPKNQDLIIRYKNIKKLTSEGVPTVPSTMDEEKNTNPFLRPWSKEIRANLNMMDATDEEVFAKIRALKDEY
tara:strand:- start:750 stop:1517 length:768 start_codon:yes stop_codon:yes gene_type:complete